MIHHFSLSRIHEKLSSTREGLSNRALNRNPVSGVKDFFIEVSCTVRAVIAYF